MLEKEILERIKKVADECDSLKEKVEYRESILDYIREEMNALLGIESRSAT